MAVEKYEVYDPFLPNYDPNHKGRVYTWGNNGQGWGDGPGYWSNGGRLGNGSATDGNSTPVVVLRGEQEPEDPCNPYPYLSRIIAVSAGEAHSMALEKNDPYDPNLKGRVYTWGDNKYGQLGNGCTDPCTVPVRVIRADGKGYLENIVAISAGYWHSLAIDADGVIWTWGKTAGGKLGLANMANEPWYICSTAHRIPVVYNETQDTFAFGTEQAIEDANDDDLLVGTWGIYYENVDFNDKRITLESEDPNDLDVVEATIIDGQYNTQGDYAEQCGVYFGSASGSRLAGFTVAEAPKGGVACVNLSSGYISDCLIRDNKGDGIYLDNSSVDITKCIIQDNGSDSTAAFCGIYCDDANASATTITNNWIFSNGIGANGAGIYLNSAYVELADLVIRHNTISKNAGYGIATEGIPDINNCIIWGNASGSLQYGDYNVSYSCIEGGYGGTGNIIDDPCFVDADVNDFHLAANSACIDAGDPDFEAEPNETDIDGAPRVINERVDIGADEFWRATDFSGDGLVNFVDYSMLARHWHQTDTDPGYSDAFDLWNDDFIDFNDVLVLCEDWLSKAEWWSDSMLLMAGGSGGRMTEGLSLQVAPSELTAVEEKHLIAEPVDVKKLLDWLAEVWLDPEVRERIDAEAWLKLYESVKDLE